MNNLLSSLVTKATKAEANFIKLETLSFLLPFLRWSLSSQMCSNSHLDSYLALYSCHVGIYIFAASQAADWKKKKKPRSRLIHNASDLSFVLKREIKKLISEHLCV